MGIHLKSSLPIKVYDDDSLEEGYYLIEFLNNLTIVAHESEIKIVN